MAMRTRGRGGWWRIGIGLVLGGWCVGGPVLIARAVSPAAPSGVRLTTGEARELCLGELPASPAGTSIDDALRRAQKRARLADPKAEDWVGVGWGWVRKARLSGDPGFYVHVAGCVEEALRLAPAEVGALALRALVLMNDHRFEDARRAADSIRAADPTNALAHGIASDALLELGRFEDAVAAAQRSADLEPGSVAYVRASYFRWLTGDVAGAKGFIRSALEGRDRRDPEPAAWTFVEAAKIFWHEGDYEGADAVLVEALRWVPDYPPALVMRGRVALALRRPERAVAVLEQAYRQRPLPEAAWLLADARGMLGDDAGAEAERARVVQAGLRGDRLTLALFYATKNVAIADALRLVDAEREGRAGVYVDDTYAWVLYRLGRIAEAREASVRARRLGTPDARILYHAGAIDIAAGVPGGRALVAKALALNPEFDTTGAAEARALLATTPEERHAS